MDSNEKPTVLEQSVTDRNAELRLHVTERLKCFEGHFPKAPIVPGVVQLHWAVEFARSLFGMNGEVDSIEVLKFQKAISPNTTVLLNLEYAAETGKLYFDFSSEDGRFSSGRIILR